MTRSICLLFYLSLVNLHAYRGQGRLGEPSRKRPECKWFSVEKESFLIPQPTVLSGLGHIHKHFSQIVCLCIILLLKPRALKWFWCHENSLFEENPIVKRINVESHNKKSRNFRNEQTKPNLQPLYPELCSQCLRPTVRTTESLISKFSSFISRSFGGSNILTIYHR